MKTVTIYTDGACSGNPGPGGWGGVLSLFLGCSASHLFRFGYLETEILRLEDLLIVVGDYLEVAGE